MAVIHRWKSGDLALADGAAVASVPDGVGSFPLAQATGANQPTFKTNALGANPSIVGGAGKFLRTAALPGTLNFTFIFVVKSTNLSAVNAVFAQLHNFADRLVIDKRSTDQWSYFGGAAHQIIAPGAVGSWQVIGFTGTDIADVITVGGTLTGGENFIGEWIECELHDTQMSAPALAAAISAKQSFYGIAGGGGGGGAENIFFEVDSYFEGQQTTSGGIHTGTAAKAVPHRVALLYADAGSFKGVGGGNVTGSNAWLIAQNGVRNIHNLAIGGRRVDQGTLAFDTEVTPRLGTGVNKMVFLGGANDTTPDTPSQILADIAAYKAKCDAQAMVFYIATWLAVTTGLNDQTGVDNYMSDLAVVNPGIVAAYPANRVIRFDRHTQLQDPTAFTVTGDGVHPNDTAQPIMAALVKKVLDGTYTVPTFSTGASLAAATQGVATERVLATTGATVTTWQFKSGTLPSGMTFDAALGKFVLSTGVAAGTYSNLVVWAIDANNHFDERAFSIVVNAASGDTTPPTGNVTAPTASQTVSGVFNFTGNASDNIAVASAQLLIDGVVNQAADTVAPYNVAVNTALLTNGAHTASFVITDTATPANTFTTPAVSFTVSNAAPANTKRMRAFCNAMTGATGYRWTRATNAAMSLNPVQYLTTLPVYRDETGVFGTTYYWTVEWNNGFGYSPTVTPSVSILQNNG